VVGIIPRFHHEEPGAMAGGRGLGRPLMGTFLRKPELKLMFEVNDDLELLVHVVGEAIQMAPVIPNRQLPVGSLTMTKIIYSGTNSC